MSYTPYQKKKLQALGEVNHLVTLALAKLNKYSGSYIGDLIELKSLVGVKIKLEQIQRKIERGYEWETMRYERSSTRTTK